MMNKFRQKNFNSGVKKTNVARRTGEYIKRNPILPISTASLGISAAGYKLGKDSIDKEQEQLDAVRDLTDALVRVDNTLQKPIKVPKTTNRKKVINISTQRKVNEKQFSIFRQKDYSGTSDVAKRAIQGANLGAGVGILFSGLGKRLTGGEIMSPKKLPLVGSDTKLGKHYDSSDNVLKSMLFVGTTTLLGGALGALVGAAETGISKISGNTEINSRLMGDVINELKKSYREGVHFTRDPKRATQLKSRVCIVITKNSGDLKLLVNTKSDRELDEVSEKIIKSLPPMGSITKTASNKFNEIKITTMSSRSRDLKIIVGICDRFIKSGNPVYLVEVG